MKIGFIGCGNMATAMLKGILKSGEVKAADMIASAKSDKTREKIEKELGNHRMPQLPQIKFVKESEMLDGPFMIGDIEVTDELLEKVEAYIQEEIEMMHEPTVLH